MISRAAYADRFEFVANHLCLEFVNTINYAGEDQNERLKDYVDLVGWGLLVDLLTDGEAQQIAQMADARPADALAALEKARALRLTLHRLFSAVAFEQLPGEDDLLALNEALQEALAHFSVVLGGDQFDWQWSAEEESLDRILWPVTWAAAELLVAADLAQVKRCSGQGCSWVFVDRSKNGSRRWCNMQHCGNRAKVRRYRSRRSG